MLYRSYLADITIPGLAEAEVRRLASQEERSPITPRGLTVRQLRDLGYDRGAS